MSSYHLGDDWEQWSAELQARREKSLSLVTDKCKEIEEQIEPIFDGQNPHFETLKEYLDEFERAEPPVGGLHTFLLGTPARKAFVEKSSLGWTRVEEACAAVETAWQESIRGFAARAETRFGKKWASQAPKNRTAANRLSQALWRGAEAVATLFSDDLDVMALLSTSGVRSALSGFLSLRQRRETLLGFWLIDSAVPVAPPAKRGFFAWLWRLLFGWLFKRKPKGPQPPCFAKDGVSLDALPRSDALQSVLWTCAAQRAEEATQFEADRTAWIDTLGGLETAKGQFREQLDVVLQPQGVSVHSSIAASIARAEKLRAELEIHTESLRRPSVADGHQS